MVRDKPDILDESQRRACKAMSRLADLLALWRSPPAYGMGMIQSVQLPWIFARRSLRSEADVGWDGSLLLERTLRIFNGCLREEGRGRSSRFASDMLGSCQRHLLMRGGTHASPLEASPLITKPRRFWPCCGGGVFIYLVHLSLIFSAICQTKWSSIKT